MPCIAAGAPGAGVRRALGAQGGAVGAAAGLVRPHARRGRGPAAGVGACAAEGPLCTGRARRRDSAAAARQAMMLVPDCRKTWTLDVFSYQCCEQCGRASVVQRAMGHCCAAAPPNRLCATCPQAATSGQTAAAAAAARGTMCTTAARTMTPTCRCRRAAPGRSASGATAAAAAATIDVCLCLSHLQPAPRTVGNA